jgi:hypothetical protein
VSPIKGITDELRLPRAGKIRIGIKKKNDKGKEYPSAVDYFVCPDEVIKVYGDKPKTLDIMFPIEDDTQFFPQWYKMYGTSKEFKDLSGLKCKGDGETATRVNKKGNMVPHECKGEECPDYISKQCRRVAILQFMLPNVPGIGVYQISTTSRNSIYNLNGGIAFIRALAGRVRMIPLKLALIDQTVQADGKKKVVKILKIDTENFCLADLQAAALVDPQRVGLPAPVDESEEDLLVEPIEAEEIEPEVVELEAEAVPVEMVGEKTIIEIMDNVDTHVEAGRYSMSIFNSKLYKKYGAIGVAGLTQEQADEVLNGFKQDQAVKSSGPGQGKLPT